MKITEEMTFGEYLEAERKNIAEVRALLEHDLAQLQAMCPTDGEPPHRG